ncbi:hypothetical protein ACQPZQ_17560 [Pseudonocardia sp. CA-142604]|uniref:hypothetical protein n=1 Tax=Pseudonocardia sp. CA-142604 TaxID=3240024 RepID=UPI003D94E61C
MSERAPGAGGGASGLDLARGLALFGVMAADVFHAAPGNGPSALGPMSAGDCPAVTFALVAGASLALAGGRCRACVRADIAVQAVLIAAIGLALGLAGRATALLSYYGVLCLVTTVFLGRRPWFLVRIAVVVLLVAPIIVTSTMDRTALRLDGNPSFSTLVTDPSGLIITLFVTGAYPVLIYLAYTCVGLAIGRMDLSSPQSTRKLLTGAAAIVAVSWIWWLALPASRTHGWVYLVRSINSLGSAVLVVAFALLLARTPTTERLLRPLTTAGTMMLTLYSGYVVVRATGVLGNNPGQQYLALVIGALLFAALWRWIPTGGPVEWLVAQFSRMTRQAVPVHRA